MSSMVRLPDNEDRIRFGEIGWQSILLGIFFKSSCKLKFQEKTKKDFTWLFEALYAHARGDSMNLKKRYWIILFPPNHRIQAYPMKICKLSSWIWSSKRQIMFTFHGWSYFLKNQLELGVSIMESVGLDVRKKKEKRKKKKKNLKEEPMSYLAYSKRRLYMLGSRNPNTINKCDMFIVWHI